ncbi:MAG: hypothetical protein M3463_03140 [Verrucomicrobiota bacterium]|nr:hypothetical protein [Verrucomicrobiota bacterium]
MFITEDGQRGRMVEVIGRGEPAMMLCHWTGIYWNGQELGFKIFQEVVRRLHARYDHLVWMKLSEVARYWAARELTRIDQHEHRIAFRAPFACADFTIRFESASALPPRLRTNATSVQLREAAGLRQLQPGTWHRQNQTLTACIALPEGSSWLEWTG